MSKKQPRSKLAAKVRVAQVTAYVTSHGWTVLPARRKDAVLFVGSDDDEGRPLDWQFPAHERFNDYGECVEQFINALAALEHRSPDEVLSDILAQKPAATAS